MRMVPQKLLALLGHGLSESGAKVYLALLDQPRMTAAGLAKVTSVPRSHLYKVLDDLHGQGLVDILLASGSRAYRARPFSEFIENRSRELRARLAELEREAQTLGETMKPPVEEEARPEAGEVRLVIGRRMVAREIDDLLASARHEILVAASALAADRVARHLGPLLERAAVPLPSITVILPSGVSWPLADARVTIRRFDVSRGPLMFLGDEDKLLVIHPIPEGGDLRSGRDFAVFSNDAVFASGHKQLLLAASRFGGVS